MLEDLNKKIFLVSLCSKMVEAILPDLDAKDHGNIFSGIYIKLELANQG